MSSNTEDPLEKQDTSTESNESEKELEKAEGTLEHLKIEAAKDDSDKSKAVESPNQEGTSSSSGDLFNKIYAEQRGIQKPHPQCCSDPEFKVACLTDPSKEKELEAKGIDEDIGTKMVEGESHKTGKKEGKPTIYENCPQRMEEGDAGSRVSTPLICQSSPAEGPSRPVVDHDADIPLAQDNPLRPRSPHQSSSSRGFDYDTTDSGDTSADVSEILSEVAECSREGNVYRVATEIIKKEESPSHAPAVERQSPDNSDTDISEIQDFVPPPTQISSLLQGIAPPPTPETSSDLQDYLPSLPTPSLIGSTSNPSGTPESEPMEDQPVSRDQRMQVCDRPLKQEQQNEENKEEMNVPEDARKRTSASILLVQKSVKVQHVEEGSPSKRRRASKKVSDSSAEEKGIAERTRSRVKKDAEKKYKKVTSIPSDLKSTSESPEPKSFSSDKFHGRKFAESKSMSEVQGNSNAEKGLLPSTQQTKVSSKDSVIAEEDQTSAIREQGLRTVETKDTTLVKMETSGGEGTAELVELSGTKPSTSRAYGSEGTLNQHEPSVGAFEYEESVEMSEQESKLKKEESSHRTRHDSADPDMRVGLGDLQQSGSTSPPDISDISTISPSEGETRV